VKESNSTPAVSNADAAKITARDEIARREGFEPKLYQDRNGNTAVGYGHTPGLPKLFVSEAEINDSKTLTKAEKDTLIKARKALDEAKGTGKYAEKQKEIVDGLPKELREKIYTPIPEKGGLINANLPNDTSGKTYRDFHPYFGSASLNPTTSGKNVLDHDLGEKIKTMLLTVKPETLNTYTQTQIAQVYDFIYWSGGSPTTSIKELVNKADWTATLYKALDNPNRQEANNEINKLFDKIVTAKPEMASRVNGYIQSWVKVNGWRDAFPKSETKKMIVRIISVFLLFTILPFSMQSEALKRDRYRCFTKELFKKLQGSWVVETFLYWGNDDSDVSEKNVRQGIPKKVEGEETRNKRRGNKMVGAYVRCKNTGSNNTFL
jgi:GH24 family phage-related lysozyme (muramidase)